METKWRIVHFDPEVDRSGFQSSEPELTEFFRAYANQYHKKNISRIYVAHHPENSDIGGFYTLSAGSISFDHLPKQVQKKLPKHPVPTIHIGRLAVDIRYQGMGLGETLLIDALKKAYVAHETVGSYAVDVIALNDKAKSFYTAYGFEASEIEGSRMFISMEAIKKLFI